MALYKRKGVWWLDITHQGQRLRRSTGSVVKAEAQHFHDQYKANLWKVTHLDEKPAKLWVDAVMRWLEESQHKRSLVTDKVHLRWLDTYLSDKTLQELSQDAIEHIAKEKEATGVAPSSVNRVLEIIRAILRKAKNQWEWIDHIPTIRFRKQNNKRIRWITREEAVRLLNELPPHLKAMASFTLSTGLRDNNVSQLRWDAVQLENRHALVHPDQSKTKKAIPVPLNREAMKILIAERGKHPKYVFTYKGEPVTRCNNHAWRKALKRAGIEDFRWHDLRHTWASWHVQSGTTLQELQILGGWSSFSMVLRYAHLSSEHLLNAAERICDTNRTHGQIK